MQRKHTCKGSHAKVHVGKHGICITVYACQRNLNDQYLVQKPCDAGSEFIAIIQFTYGERAAQRGNVTWLGSYSLEVAGLGLEAIKLLFY